MSDDLAPSALETLKKIRDEKFPGMSDDVVEKVFDAETEAQFETDRKPTIALLRDLILEENANT